MKTPYPLLSFILIIILLNHFSCRLRDDEGSSESLIPVRVVTVDQQEMEFVIHSSGRITTATEQKLSFRTGGIISKIYVKEGQEVIKGQLLAELNLTEINANLRQAEELFLKASRDHERIENLYKDTVATLEQFQNVRTAKELAASALEIARFNQNHSYIRAPHNGLIFRIMSHENEMIAPGYPVFIYGSANGSWQMKVNVTDKDIIAIRLGDSVSISLDAYPDQFISGMIAERAAVSNPFTGLFELAVQLNQTDLELLAGMIARASIFPSNERTALSIPIESLFEINGREAVVHVYEDQRGVKRNIEILKIEGDRVFIRSGLEEGEKLVTQGTNFIRANSRLEIILDAKMP
jgi:membrane fusion protein, multidrug efflux system